MRVSGIARQTAGAPIAASANVPTATAVDDVPDHRWNAPRRARLQAADVVEARLQRIGIAATGKAAKVGSFQGQEHHRQGAQHHEQADQYFYAFLVHEGDLPLIASAPRSRWPQGVENISAVRTKSIANTPSDAITTVRVVA